ncbi:RDD family protein [Polynucleobacter sp. UB-Tiil-W10]|uniref:RDD family protein n=1 Tax=Polynucleobacter sp. UB-Tiil-W10 TaxID=1855648 RepID=UPI001C0BE7E1|nr:RDD family protein [Polynucleobacter sp. UB-Tiil-W10]MBU3541365.1 RDD family protein [Polynucleobacter sp. UB-Tiil-W10]
MNESAKTPISKEIVLTRLKLGLKVSTVIALIFVASLTVLGLMSWNSESNLYQTKVVNQHKVGFCKAINRYPDGTDFTLEIASLYGEQTEQWVGWKYAKDFQYCNTNPYLSGNTYASCYFARQQLLQFFECLDPPLSIGETLTNLFARVWILALLGAFIISLLPITFLLFARLLRSGILMEKHPGWRRIQIVIAGLVLLIGVIRAFVRLNNWRNTFIEDVAISVLLALCSWVGFLLARLVMRWLKEGFEVTENAVIPKTVSEISPTSVESAKQTKPEIPMSLAPFWPRLWARIIDIFIVSLVAGLIDLPGLVLALLIPADMTMLLLVNETLASLLWLSLFLYWYDSYMHYKFQATIGKLALGIRVVNKNYEPMSLSESKSRAYLLLSKGLVFMLFYPLIQIFNAWQAKKALDNGQSVAWDCSGTVVEQKHISKTRLVAVAVLAMSLLLTQLVLQRIQKDLTRQEIRSSVMR